MKLCPFARVGPIFSIRPVASNALMAKLASHTWLPKLYIIQICKLCLIIIYFSQFSITISFDIEKIIIYLHGHSILGNP
jgi:hypothetical protein